MRAALRPGDRCYFVSATGLRLRCTVVEDALPLRTRGEIQSVPVIRSIERKGNRCVLDHGRGSINPPRIRWVPRDELRKLPKRKAQTA
jgi:hypothetical protein